MNDEVSESDRRILDFFRKVLREELQNRPTINLWSLERKDLLHDIKNMIEESQSSRPALRCRFSPDQSPDIQHFLSGPNNRDEPLKDLRRWLRDADKLIIADPYFMNGNLSGWGLEGLNGNDKVAKLKIKAEQYAREVDSVLGKVRDLEIFHLPGPNRQVKTALKRIAFVGRPPVRLVETTVIHDRVWIKNGNEARIIGTSFGGIGEKLAFMLKLPDSDLREFLDALVKIREANAVTV
jgi:hypothetical protein